MKYIDLAPNRNELVIISDMEAFTLHFCYSKRQRHGRVDLNAPASGYPDDGETPISQLEIEDVEIADEDDL